MRNDWAASPELDEYPNVTLQQLLNFPRFSITTLVHFILLLLLLLLSTGKKEWENEKDVWGKSKQTVQDVNLAKEKSDKGSNIFFGCKAR